ncbi:MAG: hypothetical protein HY268_22015 [Deltaproteobacteria bacterium]|nr:hypothetical protein [Deltaproteobacteria bacterium]
MTRLWKEEMNSRSHELRLETLNSLGGAERIVRTHLDSVVSTLSPEAQDSAAQVFHYLVTPGGAKIAHTVSDLDEYTGLGQERVTSVLEELSHQETRILRPVQPPDQQVPLRYEIFHDVLAPAILDWRARYVQVQERAEAERRTQEQQQRADEQARIARRLRWLSIGLALILILAIGATMFALFQRDRAEGQTRRAEQQTRLATARQLAAQSLSRYVRLDEGLLLSLEANYTAPDAETRSSLLDGVQRSPQLTTFLHGHTNSVVSVAWSPDGKILASGSGDNTIILWDVSFESWKARACYRANRNLTRGEWKQYIGDVELYRATCPEFPIEPEIPADGQAGKKGTS